MLMNSFALSVTNEPLVTAAFDLSLDRMRAALEAGADPNCAVRECPRQEWWAHSVFKKLAVFLTAARAASVYTIICGALNGRDTDDDDAVRYAALELLTAYGGRVSKGTATRCLLEACRAGRGPCIVSSALDAGADVRGLFNRGYSTLHLSKYLDVTAVLLAAGADVDARDNFGGTPLMVAAQRACLPTVRALVAAGADVNVQDSRGETVVHRLMIDKMTAKHLECLQELLELGADPTIGDNTGSRPLDYALQFAVEFAPIAAINATFFQEALTSQRELMLLAAATVWHRRRHLLLAIRSRHR